MMNEPIQNRLDFNDAQSAAEQGLKVVRAQFDGVEPFNWNMFDGFDRIRVLTYSVSTSMIVRMLDKFSFEHFECVFGYEGGLGRFADVIAFQQFLINQVRDSALRLEDERQRLIFERIQAGQAQFYVVKQNIAHAKLYLLEANNPERLRVIVGSANLSERAFGGRQPETLIVFDDDLRAWEHYCREYDAVKETATDRIDMPVDLRSAEISFTETPILQDPGLTVFQAPAVEELTLPQAMHKVEELAVPIDRIVSPQVARENGRYVVTPAVKAEIKRMRWQKGQQENDETRPTSLTIHQESRHVSLSGVHMPLETDAEGLRRSAEAIVEYFNNYELGFVGDMPRLQRDYFTFMSWLYISPFMCDLRTRAVVRGVRAVGYSGGSVEIHGFKHVDLVSDPSLTSDESRPIPVEKTTISVEQPTSVPPVAVARPARVAKHTWKVDSYPRPTDHDSPEWDIQDYDSVDELTATQFANSGPTLAFRDQPFGSNPVTVNISVTGSDDDDLFGFAVGHEPGDTTNESADYLLLDWKKAARKPEP